MFVIEYFFFDLTHLFCFTFSSNASSHLCHPTQRIFHSFWLLLPFKRCILLSENSMLTASFFIFCYSTIFNCSSEESQYLCFSKSFVFLFEQFISIEIVGFIASKYDKHLFSMRSFLHNTIQDDTVTNITILQWWIPENSHLNITNRRILKINWDLQFYFEKCV